MNKLIKLLKSLISLQTVSIVIGLASLWVAYVTFLREHGGKLEVKYNQELLTAPTAERDIMVVYSDPEVDLTPFVPLTPTYANVERYTINGFYVKHNIKTDGQCSIAPTLAYNERTASAGTQYSFNDNYLLSHSDAGNPFEYFKVRGNGSATIESTAACDGADAASKFRTTITWHSVPRYRYQDFDAWRKVAESNLVARSDKPYDLYLISNDKFVPLLAYNPSQAQPAPATPAEKPAEPAVVPVSTVSSGNEQSASMTTHEVSTTVTSTTEAKSVEVAVKEQEAQMNTQSDDGKMTFWEVFVVDLKDLFLMGLLVSGICVFAMLFIYSIAFVGIYYNDYEELGFWQRPSFPTYVNKVISETKADYRKNWKRYKQFTIKGLDLEVEQETCIVATIILAAIYLLMVLADASIYTFWGPEHSLFH